jgi:phosphate transport system substrate-binding protein
MLKRFEPARLAAPSRSLIRTTWSGTAPAALVLLLVMAGTLLAGCSILQSTPASLEGQITIAGSTALQPLVTQAAGRFMQANSRVKISVSGGGSLMGLQEVNAHKVDIGDSDVYADPATYPDPNLTDHLVAVIPFAMITNLDVNISTLSTDQIIAIFSTGTIRNWRQVGGPNLAIVPVVRPATSGTRASFRKYVLGGRDEQGKLLQSDSSQTVVQTVADTPGAIGYLALSVLNSSVREVAIDGQLPSVKTIQTGQYAFWGFEHMYTIGQGSAAMVSFLNYMLTPQIQQLAEKLGYFSIAAMAVASRNGSDAGNKKSVETTGLYRPRKDAAVI